MKNAVHACMCGDRSVQWNFSVITHSAVSCALTRSHVQLVQRVALASATTAARQKVNAWKQSDHQTGITGFSLFMLRQKYPVGLIYDKNG